MTSGAGEGLDRGSLDDEDVVQYLRTHPELFERRPDALEGLKLHHASGAAASLIEKQVEMLRRKNAQLERKLTDLLEVARDNEGLSTRVHRLALGLMDADGVDEVLATSKELLRTEFPGTEVMIYLLGRQADRHGTPDLELVEDLFDQQRPMCGRLDDERVQALFGAGAAHLGSVVLVPLSDGVRLGLLAMGSAEPGRFQSGLGTLFLGHLGALISRAVKIHRARDAAR